MEFMLKLVMWRVNTNNIIVIDSTELSSINHLNWQYINKSLQKCARIDPNTAEKNVGLCFGNPLIVFINTYTYNFSIKSYLFFLIPIQFF